MADKIKVIVNPYGGRLAKQDKLRQLEQALQNTGVNYHLELMDYSGHGIELARQASLAGWPIVAAAGGDGTIHEVINGLLQAAGEAEAGTLGIIPLGSANDLAMGLNLPHQLSLACQRLAIGQTRLIDIGQVNHRYFINNSAIGLEAVVTATQEQMRWLKGNLRYIVAAVQTIIRAKSWHVSLSWNSGGYEGPAILVSVGNNNRTGGSFLMTPHAVVDDGLLDFIYAMNMRRWQLLWLLPQTFIGKHIHHPRVAYRQTTSLSIVVSPPTPIQADGEIIDRDATQINYRIIPKKLRVIV